MATQLPLLPARRRSDRVSIAFPIEVGGIDLTGKRFSERTSTTTVSRYGCCVTLSRSLRADQAIHIRRLGTNEMMDGRVVSSLGVMADGRQYGVGSRKSCEGLWGIRFSSSLYEKLLDHIDDGVYFVDRDRKITYWNDGAQKLSGYSASEVIGKRCSEDFLGSVDGTGKALRDKQCSLHEVMKDGQPREEEMYLRHHDGHRIPISVRAFPMRNEAGSIVGAVKVFSDSLTRRKVEKNVSALERLAFRDVLTSLPNRRYLEMKVDQALEEHQRFGRLYGLLMFDLDRFKHVNDTHGHEVGDALLKAVAKTLLHGLRPLDLVGRWGGEEFLVLMPDADALDLGDLAERCRMLIAQSSVTNSSSGVSVTASIGATVLSHSDSLASAIRRVDELMYQSKRSGGDRTTAG
jgi:diguanylate cyclase (GGDEF)-like protein/PAS domain S-box-containing protein